MGTVLRNLPLSALLFAFAVAAPVAEAGLISLESSREFAVIESASSTSVPRSARETEDERSLRRQIEQWQLAALTEKSGTSTGGLSSPVSDGPSVSGPSALLSADSVTGSDLTWYLLTEPRLLLPIAGMDSLFRPPRSRLNTTV